MLAKSLDTGLHELLKKTTLLYLQTALRKILVRERGGGGGLNERKLKLL